jgi:hypothetical protein
MIRKSVVGIALLFTFRFAFAQDFQKTYDIGPGGQILIENFLGNVKVTGYNGTGVEVKAYKKGQDVDAIRIEDFSFGNRIQLRTHYPHFYNGATTVDFEVRVPGSTEYNFDRLSSFGGNVEVTNVLGRLRADSVRGNVEVKDVRGLVSASSVSGNVSARIDRLEGPSNMRFTSISGNIVVSAPANLDALIDMSSASGLLRTDFPIDVQERRYGPGSIARGKLGSGKQILHISSVSGRVSLIQR